MTPAHIYRARFEGPLCSLRLRGVDKVGAMMCMVLAASLAGCAMKMSGMVTDARTHQPLGGARIRLQDRLAYTSPVGVYQVKVHRRSTATVEVSAAGFAPATVTCATPARRSVCDVALDRLEP